MEMSMFCLDCEKNGGMSSVSSVVCVSVVSKRFLDGEFGLFYVGSKMSANLGLHTAENMFLPVQLSAVSPIVGRVDAVALSEIT